MHAGSLEPLAASIGAVALAVLVATLAVRVALLPWALVLFALDYGVVDVARSEPLLLAPLYGAGLLLTAELVYAARELRRAAEEQAVRRLLYLGGVLAGALAAACVPLAALDVGHPSGIAAALIALAASSALIGTPALLLRRTARRG